MKKLDTNNPYRNSNNVLLIKGLFIETSSNPETAIYTLQDQDHMDRPSLYRLYMETGDPTEFAFAQEHLDGWTHWEALSGSTWFQPYVARWRKELELSLRSQALARIIETSRGTTKDAFTAAKFITQGQYAPSGSTKGRPSKQQIADAAHEIASDKSRLTEDYERIANLRVINQ